MREIAAPTSPAPGWLIVRVRAAGLCRTDLLVAEGRLPVADGRVLGHEFAGEVVGVGLGAGFREGDAVAVFPFVPCRACPACTQGRGEGCHHPAALGIDLNGCFAELVAIPAACAHKIPSGLGWRRAAYAEPVAASLAVAKTGLEKDERVLVFGKNRIADLTARALRLLGWRQVEWGEPSLADGGWDAIVETSVPNGSLDALIGGLRPGGAMVLKSRRRDPVLLSIGAAVAKEIRLIAVNYAPFSAAIELLCDPAFLTDGLFGDSYRLEDAAAFLAAGRVVEAKKTFLEMA